MERLQAMMDTIKKYNESLSAAPDDHNTLHRRGMARLTIATITGDLDLLNDSQDDFKAAVACIKNEGKEPLQAMRSLEVIRRTKLYLERAAMEAYWYSQANGD